MSSQVSRLNMKGEIAKFNLMRFKDQELGLKAKKYPVSASWDELMDTMRECVRSQFNEKANDDCIHFCCYLVAGEHRMEFREVEFLRLQAPHIIDHIVLFWIVEEKD